MDGQTERKIITALKSKQEEESRFYKISFRGILRTVALCFLRGIL